jgi:hypothetical protein
MNFRAAAVVPVTLVILLALAMLLAPAPCLGALPMVAGFEVSSAPSSCAKGAMSYETPTVSVRPCVEY